MPIPNPAENNAPVTSASFAAAVGAVLAAFTEMTGDQVAAVIGIVGIVGALVVQHWHTDPKGTP